MTNEKVAKINIQTVDLDSIKAAVYNPRVSLTPDDPEYQKILQSVNGFGYADPLILNSHNNVLISGHQRLTILKSLGYTSADVSIVNITDPKKEKSMNIAMNKITGRWDEEKIKEILIEFDVYDEHAKLAGFEKDEFERLKDAEESIDDGEHGSGIGLSSKFEIIVECVNEQQQNDLFNELGDRGIKCRVVTF